MAFARPPPPQSRQEVTAGSPPLEQLLNLGVLARGFLGGDRKNSELGAQLCLQDPSPAPPPSALSPSAPLTWMISPRCPCPALLGWEESRTKRSRCWKRRGPDISSPGVCRGLGWQVQKWVPHLDWHHPIMPAHHLSHVDKHLGAGHRRSQLGHSEACGSPLRPLYPQLPAPGLPRLSPASSSGFPLCRQTQLQVMEF